MKHLLFIAAFLLCHCCNAQDSLDIAYVKTKGDQWQIIDRTGKVLVDSLFEHPDKAMLNCSEGMVIIEKGGKLGFKNLFHPGHTITGFDSVSTFRKGVAAVHTNTGWQLINKDFVLTQAFPKQLQSYFQPEESAPACKDMYCLVETDTFVNCKGPDGKLLLAKSDVFVAPWNDVNSFINDRILKYKVMANKICSCHKMTSYYGFIDRNDKWVIEPDYEQADIFACGLASAGVGFEDVYTYGYIGMNGDWVIKPVYKEAGRFVRIGGK